MTKPKFGVHKLKKEIKDYAYYIAKHKDQLEDHVEINNKGNITGIMP